MNDNLHVASSREMARKLLSTHPDSSSRPEPTAVPTAPSRTRRTRSPFDDHPEVRSVALRNSMIRALEEGTTLPSPTFLSRSGPNGPRIDTARGTLTNYSSYDYLGLARHPAVITAAQDALERYGASASASRILSGEIDLYASLEERLARMYDVEAAMITTSGYMTNAGTLAFIIGDGDAAICDSLIHASVVSGLQWSGARRLKFRHNDVDSLRDVLRTARSQFNRVVVILEGIYSMDGDIGNLPEIAALAREHDCAVMIDEAHSLAVLGQHGYGAREHFGLAGEDVDIWMGTLSKALGSCGGFIAGKASLVDAVRSAAPGVAQFTGGPAPSAAAAALAALDVMAAEPDRRKKLWHNAATLAQLLNKAGVNLGLSQGTPICPVVVPGEANVVYASSLLLQRGIYVGPVTSPAVPAGEERLRLFLTCEHTEEQLRHTASQVADVIQLSTGLDMSTLLSHELVQTMLAEQNAHLGGSQM